MITRYGNLEKGDLIGVSYGGYIHLAIFAGEGSKKNVNFYLPSHVLLAKERGATKLYKSYINRTELSYSSPVVKIDVENLTNQQDKLNYLEASEYLKQIGA